MATKPGDGKSSPFGNGEGGTGMARVKPEDLIANPRGTTGGKAVPPNFPAEKPFPQPAAKEDANPDSIVTSDGGKVLKADPSGEDFGNPVGTTANGAKNKPFKLGS